MCKGEATAAGEEKRSSPSVTATVFDARDGQPGLAQLWAEHFPGQELRVPLGTDAIRAAAERFCLTPLPPTATMHGRHCAKHLCPR